MSEQDMQDYLYLYTYSSYSKTTVHDLSEHQHWGTFYHLFKHC